jgi:hypothetical protein
MREKENTQLYPNNGIFASYGFLKTDLISVNFMVEKIPLKYRITCMSVYFRTFYSK